MTVVTARPSRLIRRPVVKTTPDWFGQGGGEGGGSYRPVPLADLAEVLAGILTGIELVQRKRLRETCYGCGCLCLPDEACPGCRARAAARRGVAAA